VLSDDVVTVVERVVDAPFHGCQMKSAINPASTTSAIRLAAPIGLPEFTITVRLCIAGFSGKVVVQRPYP
jgi:hypothetical protein